MATANEAARNEQDQDEDRDVLLPYILELVFCLGVLVTWAVLS
jgi:hypothetical protein